MPIRNKRDYLYYLQADLCSSKLTKWKRSYKDQYPILYYQRIMRKVGYYRAKQKHSRLYKFLYDREVKKFKKLSIQLGFTIYSTAFGPGLKIGHYGSIIVNGRARIGKNCVIQSDVNIGIHNDGVPMIGNNVYIGPGAKLFGPIKIGDNVTIGANAVVNRDIPSNCVVAGVPAKIIKENAPSTTRKGANKARQMPLPLTWWDKLRLKLGFDQELKDWPVK
ncbi:serine acetyltransferase [Bacillus sp. AFS076308]|uniref:serine acetyltransferase n=1 Tax=Bacillus sp. AFS076308 TaxID=2033512 RepID=UPI000BFA25F7|nr:DapH/DapD/GlmU-related protein [Bacillus sp. AFS076308]PFN80579.1 serine acetyltransferase [Bacillus sp. AFS076308]